jgi:hypothetical protein
VSAFGVVDLELAAVEVGYIVMVAVLTKTLLTVTKRIERWRTARGVRQLWKTAEQDPAPPAACDYRTNAANPANAAEPSRSSWLSRRRAERAARYVQKLEDEATMKG